MEDLNRYKEYRTALVEQIKNRGIRDERILAAISRVPRHLFVNSSISPEEAYEDVPQRIGQGQTISQPFTVAFQSELLLVKPGEKILEIGTGSGYQAAVLFELGAKVYSIERQKKLYLGTKDRLRRLGYSDINMFYGDGNEGLPEHAPFDKVIITAAAPEIPKKLIEQTRIGGVMVAPVNSHFQKMLRITKISETENNIEEFGDFNFVPMLRGVER